VARMTKKQRDEIVRASYGINPETLEVESDVTPRGRARTLEPFDLNQCGSAFRVFRPIRSIQLCNEVAVENVK
jgi:hypothetical protein